MRHDKENSKFTSIACKWAVGALATLVLTSAAQAQVSFSEASGKGTNSGGGGVTINLSNRPHLREFVDPSACRYIWARDFQKRYVPETQTVIDQVKAAHWYFGDAYEREIDRLKVCMTRTTLKEVDVTDRDSVAIFKTGKNQRQLAVRINDKIYLDMTIFEAMQVQKEKDFAFIHEVTHSFLPLSVPQRNDSLRSFVLMLSEDTSARGIALNIEANHIDMPVSTSELDPFKKVVLAAVARNSSLQTKMLARCYTESFKLWSADRQQLLAAAELGGTLVNHTLYSNRELQSKIGEYNENAVPLNTIFTMLYPSGEKYEGTFLSMELEKGDLYNVRVLMNEKQVVPGLVELRELARQFNENPPSKLSALLSNDPTSALANEVIAKVPMNKLSLYAQDPKVKASPYLMKLIAARFSEK